MPFSSIRFFWNNKFEVLNVRAKVRLGCNVTFQESLWWDDGLTAELVNIAC